MDTITIDADKAISLLREAVKGHEDFVYEQVTSAKNSLDFDAKPACAYERDGEASCVVGKALFLAGVTIEELAEMDTAPNAAIGAVGLPERIVLSGDARDVFRTAQAAQDMHYSWGSSLNLAEQRYSLLGS